MIPERFRGELLTMGRYTNLCTFTFKPGFHYPSSRCVESGNRALDIVAVIPTALKMDQRCAALCVYVGNSTLIDLCDIDNDQVGCEQLCVLAPVGRKQCACAVGFRLAANQRSCLSGS